MFGNLPFCNHIPSIKGLNINFFTRKWDQKEDVEFLAIVLLSQVLESKFTLYEVEPERDLVANLNKSHIGPLRKYPIFHLVSFI